MVSVVMVTPDTDSVVSVTLYSTEGTLVAMAVDTDMISIGMLKMNDFIGITVFCDIEKKIAAAVGAWNSVIYDAIIIDFFNLQAVVVPVDTEEQARKRADVKLECLGNVVVELFAIRPCVHADHGTVE